ncbi:MAG TPA: ATPase domain-containing protein [Stellaceae bacterium]|nr:ATPase domain-containing protein [Stellaceae bacterium]
MAIDPIDADRGAPLERVPTGIPGLDTVLRGGFLKAGIYIVRGDPGTGKTILGNQFCFNHVAAGHRAVYVTLLTETHDRMMQHMQAMSFFERSCIPDGIYYVNGFRVIEEDGINGFIDLLRREIRAHDATLLVLDGLVVTEESSGSDRDFRKFIRELQAYIAIEGCTALLLTNGCHNEYHPEHTMVDGLIELHDVLFGTQAERELEVHKLRGTDALRGRHPFRITDGGIVVYPRIEALLARPSADDRWPDERCATGVAELDAMLGGGIPRGTTTLVLGASGSGKTSLGLHFLSQSAAEEPGLFFGFYEMPLRLRVKAAHIGIRLDSLIEKGHLEILWHPATEDILDALGNRLIEAVRCRRVKRLVIDGLLGFQEIAADRPHRIGRFLTALANELRVLNVTTFYTAETRNLIGSVIEGPTIGLSTIAENLILLRYVELRSQLRRLISIVKMRDSDFDSSLREFQITSAGLELARTFDSAEAILSGFPQLKSERLPADDAARRPRGQ